MWQSEIEKSKMWFSDFQFGRLREWWCQEQKIVWGWFRAPLNKGDSVTFYIGVFLHKPFLKDKVSRI